MLTDEAPLREPINEPLHFLEPPAASPLARQLDDWLDEHPDWFAAASPPRAGEKYIRDPVHGSIVITAAEARILDSGPFQRLRGIFQLGLAWIAYPSARHSRFEHSLGVRYVAGCILDRLEIVRGRPYLPEHRATVLAAALVHDVGHGAFSHASEAIIAEHPVYAGQIAGDEHPHEFVGAALIERDPIQGRLVDTGADPALVAALIRQHPADKAALAAAGFPREMLGVISGPLDADKLDYFARDAYFSGMRSLVDLDRVLQTLTITEEGQVGLTLAGASALEAILYSRIDMHAHLYGHQKVLAGESMVRGIIEELVGPARDGHLGSAGRGSLTLRGKGGAPRQVAFRLIADFLRVDDRTFLAAPTDQPRVADLQDRILRREMLKRAFSLSYDQMPAPLVRATSARANGQGIGEDDYLRFLLRLLSEPGQLERLRWAILRDLPHVRTSDLWVRATDVPDVVNTDRYVVDRAGKPTRNATMFAGWDRRDALLGAGVPLHPTLRNYLLLKAKVHVFCPPSEREAVGTRARTAIAALYEELRARNAAPSPREARAVGKRRKG